MVDTEYGSFLVEVENSVQTEPSQEEEEEDVDQIKNLLDSSEKMMSLVEGKIRISLL